MKKSGFTLVELLVAMVLFGVVGTAMYQVLITNQRIYRQQAQRVDVNSNVRAALAMISGELRELNASDALGSDIISMSATQITYKAVRNLSLLCLDPDVAAAQITVFRNFTFGLRSLDILRDSVVIFADGGPDDSDDLWLHANASGVTTGLACPGGVASTTITLTGISSPGLDEVLSGAPLRSFEIVQLTLYQDVNSDYWFGTSSYNKTGGVWGSIQPILGPLTANGLQLEYYDATGTVTAIPAAVARISITVTGQSAEPVRTPDGSIDYLTVDLVTHVALRNNR